MCVKCIKILLKNIEKIYEQVLKTESNQINNIDFFKSPIYCLSKSFNMVSETTFQTRCISARVRDIMNQGITAHKIIYLSRSSAIRFSNQLIVYYVCFILNLYQHVFFA